VARSAVADRAWVAWLLVVYGFLPIFLFLAPCEPPKLLPLFPELTFAQTATPKPFKNSLYELFDGVIGLRLPLGARSRGLSWAKGRLCPTVFSHGVPIHRDPPLFSPPHQLTNL
jgi:hypothetical protein